MQCGKYDGISALWKDPDSTIRLERPVWNIQWRSRGVKTLTCLISIGYRAEALGKGRTRCEWEHFKDQTFCPGLRRQPDSLLLSVQRGAPGWWWWWWWWEGGRRQEDRQSLFSILLHFCPAARVSELRHVQTAWRVSEIRRVLGSAVTAGGGGRPSMCVGGCDGESRGGREKRGRKHGREREDGGIEAKDTGVTSVEWLDASGNVWMKHQWDTSSSRFIRLNLCGLSSRSH